MFSLENLARQGLINYRQRPESMGHLCFSVSLMHMELENFTPQFIALTTAICYDADFVFTGGIGSCHNDNLRCHPWRPNGYKPEFGAIVKLDIEEDSHLSCPKPLNLILLLSCRWGW